MMKTDTNLYSELKEIAEEYLGPAGERFLKRQIQFHLKKKPSEITANDLSKLTEWIKVSLAVLTDDEALVDECVGKIEQLAK